MNTGAIRAVSGDELSGYGICRLYQKNHFSGQIWKIRPSSVHFDAYFESSHEKVQENLSGFYASHWCVNMFTIKKFT